MIFTGLENDYYLAGNDIWLRLHSILEPSLKLELVCTNLTTGETLKKLTMYPSPANEYQFNISQCVRALFQEPSLTTYNNLQQFSFAFILYYVNTATPNTEFTHTKYFIRGFQKKQGTKEWYLADGAELVIKPWATWVGVTLPNAQKIQGGVIAETVPSTIKVNFLKDCEYKIIKFLNSLGGWQYFIFEAWEIKPKVKSLGRTNRTPNRLREDGFRNIGLTVEEEIELQARTPFDMQDIILDLIYSSEVYMYDPNGDDANSQWIALEIDSNSAIKNSFDFVFENKLTYNIINNVNVWL